MGDTGGGTREPKLVVEVPYVFAGRTAGESKMNYKEATGYWDQLRDLRRFEREHHARVPRHLVLTAEQLRRAPSGL